MGTMGCSPYSVTSSHESGRAIFRHRDVDMVESSRGVGWARIGQEQARVRMDHPAGGDRHM